MHAAHAVRSLGQAAHISGCTRSLAAYDIRQTKPGMKFWHQQRNKHVITACQKRTSMCPTCWACRMCSITNECDAALAPPLVCRRFQQGRGAREEAVLYHALRVSGLHPGQQLWCQSLSCSQCSLQTTMPGTWVSIMAIQQAGMAETQERSTNLSAMSGSKRHLKDCASPDAFQHYFWWCLDWKQPHAAALRWRKPLHQTAHLWLRTPLLAPTEPSQPANAKPGPWCP